MISIVSATLIVDMCSLFPAHAFPPYWVGLAGLANLHYLCIYCSLLLRFGPYSTPHTNWHACCTISSFCPRIHEDPLQDTLQCRAHLCTLRIQSNGRHARIERVGGKNKKIKYVKVRERHLHYFFASVSLLACLQRAYRLRVYGVQARSYGPSLMSRYCTAPLFVQPRGRGR